jgi:hypothetical protein
MSARSATRTGATMAEPRRLPAARDEDRCQEMVLERDTYRVNRGPGPHFKLHYRERQCGRKAIWKGYCWQHARWHGLHPEGLTSLRQEGE